MSLQYSVFHCRLTPRQRKALVSELHGLIEVARDDVRIYSIQADLPIRYVGQSPLPDVTLLTGIRLICDESGSQR